MVSVKGSKITLNGQSVTVVNQHKLKGTYAKELSAHGCGACCAAMALCLMGKKATPANVIGKGVALWGKWKKSCTLSGVGIQAIIKKYGYKSKYYKVSALNRPAIKRIIKKALKSGKPVICWTSHGGFSSWQHYVLAVGYNKLGRVVVANSGNRGPVNVVTLDALCKSLQEGNGKDKGWYNTVRGSAGIVIVWNKPAVKKVKAKGVNSDMTAYDLRTLKRGAKGQQVKVLQKLLGGLPVGGAFGAKTEARLKEYQKRHGLKVDGVAGPNTWAKLLK